MPYASLTHEQAKRLRALLQTYGYEVDLASFASGIQVRITAKAEGTRQLPGEKIKARVRWLRDLAMGGAVVFETELAEVVDYDDAIRQAVAQRPDLAEDDAMFCDATAVTPGEVL